MSVIFRKDLVHGYSPNKQVFDIIQNPNQNEIYGTNEKILQKGKHGCEIILSAFSLSENDRPVFAFLIEKEDKHELSSLITILRFFIRAIVFR
jgi:hypothetical protein